MKRWNTQLAGVAKTLSAAAVLGFAAQVGAADITWDRLQNADKDANNWLMYHGSYKGWHYSPLDQITKSNVKNLKVAWIHSPSTGKRGTPGESIDIPLAHKDALYVRSHYDTMTVQFADAPNADEIVIAFAFASRGRLHARLGGLAATAISGSDGLR